MNNSREASAAFGIMFAAVVLTAFVALAVGGVWALGNALEHLLLGLQGAFNGLANFFYAILKPLFWIVVVLGVLYILDPTHGAFKMMAYKYGAKMQVPDNVGDLFALADQYQHLPTTSLPKRIAVDGNRHYMLVDSTARPIVTKNPAPALVDRAA